MLLQAHPQKNILMVTGENSNTLWREILDNLSTDICGHSQNILTDNQFISNQLLVPAFDLFAYIK